VNKHLFFLTISLLFLLLSCDSLNNPYDSKSDNYVSDSTLVSYVTRTIIDTTVFIHTIIRVDTILYVDSCFHVDTSFYIDTLFHYDTLFDTIPLYDSIGYIDTLTINDTTHILDTQTLFDTTHLYFDIYDTIPYYDTVFQFDTTFLFDTLIDTVLYYGIDPFIRLVSYPDSATLSSYVPDSQYQLTYRVTGIDPAIINSVSYRTCGGACVWQNVNPPWTRTFSGQSSDFYIKLFTDSGVFVDSFSLFNRYQQPVPHRLDINAGPYSYSRTASAGFSTCTLYTQDANYGSNGSNTVLSSIFFYVESPHPSCGSGSYWEFYWSWNNNYSTSADHIACGDVLFTDPSLAIEDIDLSTGLKTLNIKARCCASPTWSVWHVINILVLAGPKP
jgi:hypothetical protein